MKLILNTIQVIAIISLGGMALNMGGKAAESFSQVKAGLVNMRSQAVEKTRLMANGQNTAPQKFNWH